MKKLLAIVISVCIVCSNVLAAVENVDSSKLAVPGYFNNVLIIVYGERENNSEVFVNCKPETKDGKVKVLLGRLMSALDYTGVDRTETDMTISNGARTIQLIYGENQAKVDDKIINLKSAFAVENKSVYYNYIDIEDIEALFSYRVAYDNANNNVVLFVTEATPDEENLPELTEALKAETTMEQKLAELKAYGIFQGNENGDLNLDKQITRAEFCKVICAALGYIDKSPKTADGSDIVYDEDENVYVVSTESIFNDVSATHWAYKYIKTLYNMGFIYGVGDNRFCPSDSITEIDAIKIIVSVLGYTPMAEQMGGYPDGFRRTGEKLGIITDNPNNAILRERVVEYLYTALDTPLMSATEFDFSTNTSRYIIQDGNNGAARITLRINLDNHIK